MAVIPTENLPMVHGGRSNILILLILEAILIVVYGCIVRYAPEIVPQDGVQDPKKLQDSYHIFSHVHIMVYVGFGFLMTFMKRYMFSGVAYNFLLGAIMCQWAIITIGIWTFAENSYEIRIEPGKLLEADVAVAAVLISMGAVLGRTTYLQLIIMGFFELLIYSANYYLKDDVWIIQDCGDSIYVHVFGAYFGLAVSFVLNIRNKETPPPEEMQSTYISDTFAMIGTIFLWIFWPTFNASGFTEPGERQMRNIVNTYISLAASTVAAFCVSGFITHEKKFDMVHIQNSTLAGGVAVGAVANLMIHPVGALMIGTTAGIISVLGYEKLTPVLESKLKIPDTCGVHNLHGMPGVLAGVMSVAFAMTASQKTYKSSLYEIYPAMGPVNVEDSDSVIEYVTAGLGRSAMMQGVYQLIALVVTLLLAISGGLLTGKVMLLDIFEPDRESCLHKDDAYWNISETENQTVNDVKPPVFLVRQYQQSNIDLKITEEGLFISIKPFSISDVAKKWHDASWWIIHDPSVKEENENVQTTEDQ